MTATLLLLRAAEIFLEMLLHTITYIHTCIYIYQRLPHFLYSCTEVETGHDGSSDTGVPLPNRPLVHHSMFPMLLFSML